ncbi:MAG: hypothetical protein ACLP1X_05275 [Polyangiaceae bacterium]
MSRHLPVTALALLVAVPLPWLACGGGESKPPESPASESSASASSDESKAADMPAPAASASASADTSSSKSAAPAETATSAPPPPSFGSTDCGQCVDKTCAKPAAACGKDTDCTTTLDAIHSCSSGAAACVDGASLPSTAKPKKLAKAYEACVKKAATSKACKTKCQ